MCNLINTHTHTHTHTKHAIYNTTRNKQTHTKHIQYMIREMKPNQPDSSTHARDTIGSQNINAHLRFWAASPPSPPALVSVCWNFRAWIMSRDQNEFSDLICSGVGGGGDCPRGAESTGNQKRERKSDVKRTTKKIQKTKGEKNRKIMKSGKKKESKKMMSRVQLCCDVGKSCGPLRLP